ncbi:hypothetical protein OG21DRAFT_373194 [Imleria badia]|nr:hypothetical protein OG21DRAFT_373194 [Imleria badia]
MLLSEPIASCRPTRTVIMKNVGPLAHQPRLVPCKGVVKFPSKSTTSRRFTFQVLASHISVTNSSLEIQLDISIHH